MFNRGTSEFQVLIAASVSITLGMKKTEAKSLEGVKGFCCIDDEGRTLPRLLAIPQSEPKRPKGFLMAMTL
jgi:hypothetical protein